MRDVNREQESTNGADYEEIEINQQSESTVISIADNVAYEHISPKNCIEHGSLWVLMYELIMTTECTVPHAYRIIFV